MSAPIFKVRTSPPMPFLVGSIQPVIFDKSFYLEHAMSLPSGARSKPHRRASTSSTPPLSLTPPHPVLDRGPLSFKLEHAAATY
uniref:Uncharacterized protein n=1 Tax=Arundo donax TaxID=35708 RepID=A0A0A8Z8F2_ARUDO